METNKIPYHTKQQDRLLTFLQKTGGRHVTVEEICSHFAKSNSPIGIATIYRNLEKLVSQGIVTKYIIDENTAACFSYKGICNCNENSRHFHLKCEQCGRLIHLECEQIDEIENHLLEEHGFSLDPMRTVLYGTCRQCAKKTERKKRETNEKK